MNCHFYSSLRRLGVLSFTGLWLVNSVHAGEKIHFSDSPEQLDVPKPTTRDERISNRFGKSNNSVPQADVPVEVGVPTAARPTANPLMSQKLEEYLDKKRNWMFIDPKDKDKPGSEQNLQANEISLDAEKKKPKTVQEQFYDHPSDNIVLRKKNSSSKESVDSDKDDIDGRDQKSDADKSSLTPELSLGSLLRQNERTDGVLRSVGDLSRANALQNFAPEPSESARRADREREMRQHDADFAKIIAPRSSGSSFSASSDPVNTQNDVTRQEANPFAPRRGVAGFGTSSTADSSQSFSPAAGIPRTSGTESFASKLPSAPTFSSSSTFSASPAPAFQPERKPIFFTPPHRQF
ncbi:MAG: hypothetical protein JWM99_4847 [Verrucomicrobiales bacterium]|jgi:hypothetical protein|nr:hypothetical protein [Verrucomicrobiales bacterium]